MDLLQGKNIVLGVSGGIAAYKSAELVRRLREAGANTRVVMTEAATRFVTPLTFQALSGHPAHVHLLDCDTEAGMGHIELARWADAVLIAPASANTVARLSHGLADNLLTTICLATEAPIAVAPAMNRVMWNAAVTQTNMDILRQRGVSILGPGSGEQACGEIGEGRMLEAVELVEKLGELFIGRVLQGRRVMITAGPTREPIDPVRFISNRSSGKMGYALAQAAAEAGAEVILVSGPVKLPAPPKVSRIEVESAEQMLDAVMNQVTECDIFIATAAVSDYRPVEIQAQKIKKTADEIELRLRRNPDILATVGAIPNGPFTVGFAAETEQVEHYALGKLKAKGLNMIAANRVGMENSGFDSDYNALDVFWADGKQSLLRNRKSILARQLIELVAQRYQAIQ